MSHAPCLLAEAIAIDLQEFDAFFEQPGMDEIMNGEQPELQPGDEPLLAPKAMVKMVKMVKKKIKAKP